MLPPVRFCVLPVLAVVCAISMSSASWAEPAEPETARQRAAAAFASAETAERELRFHDAWLAYTDAFAADPSAPFAPRARFRMRWLEERSEGDYVPLATLEAVRRDPKALSDLDRVAAFEQTSHGFPPGRTRIAAWLLVGDAFFTRLARPDLALPAYVLVLEDPTARDSERVLALDRLVACCQARGELSGAVAAVDRWGDVAPDVRDHVHVLYRRQRLGWGAYGVLAVTLALGVAAIARLALRTRSAYEVGRSIVHPYALPFALYVAGAGALAVSAYDGTDPRPFFLFGAGIVVIGSIARAWRVAHPALRARVAFAIWGALAVAALAFVALAQSDAVYLESFGL